MGLRKKKTLLEQAEGYVEQAIDQAKEFVQDTALPALSDAKEKAGPAVATAREKAAPVVAAGAATVAQRATEAKQFAETKAAELNGSKPKKRSKIKTLLMLGALGGAIAVIAKKLQGGSGDSGGWQTSYDPAPPPSPAASVPVNGTEPTAAVDETPAPTEAAPDPLSDPLPSESDNP